MDWTNLALFALLTIGHTELLVAIVNRSHALPLKHERLSTIRHLHDLLVPLFPCLLIGAVGLAPAPGCYSAEAGAISHRLSSGTSLFAPSDWRDCW